MTESLDDLLKSGASESEIYAKIEVVSKSRNTGVVGETIHDTRTDPFFLFSTRKSLLIMEEIVAPLSNFIFATWNDYSCQLRRLQ